MTDRKSAHVVMIGNSYGHEDGDVVPVTPEQADRLIRNGTARAPHKGEVKEAKGE